ncbi:MAG TPA: hypothetical protein VEG68_03060 [Terriglobales bacterium]|nr:hypothetical protein [Terriglobales bacterium]
MAPINGCVRQVRESLEAGLPDLSRIIFLLLRFSLDVVAAGWILYFAFIRHFHPQGFHELILTAFAAIFVLFHLAQILRKNSM